MLRLVWKLHQFVWPDKIGQKHVRLPKSFQYDWYTVKLMCTPCPPACRFALPLLGFDYRGYRHLQFKERST